MITETTLIAKKAISKLTKRKRSNTQTFKSMYTNDWIKKYLKQ